jgi:hypothetical protein
MNPPYEITPEFLKSIASIFRKIESLSEFQFASYIASA